jgi:putative peptidoglycan lipid II flippase
VSVSGVLQLLLLQWAVRRAGIHLHLPRPRLTPEMRRLLRRMAPGLLGAGVTQLNLSVDVIIGSLLPPGTVSVLYYADRVNQLPLGTIGAAVGTALLPTLSRQIHSDVPGQAIGTMNRALEYALLLTLPAALALLVSAHPIISVLFGRGAFGAHSVALSATALQAYASGLPAFVLVKVLINGFFARADTATPVKLGVACVALNLALNLVFMHPLQHLGPPLASSVAAWVNVAGLTAILVRRGHFATDETLRQRVPRMLAAGFAMCVVLWAAQAAFAPLFLRPGLRWLALAALVGAGAAAYGIAGQVLGGFDLRVILGRVARRRAPAPS